MKKLFLGFFLLQFSCVKTNIEFSNTGRNENPDISYLESVSVSLESYKVDSFVTSGSSVMMVGKHEDPFIGTTTAFSFLDLTIPAKNTALDEDVIFDSMVVFIQPTGSYYGDTSSPFTLTVHQLTEEIENEADDPQEMFNGRLFTYNRAPLTTVVTSIRPKRGTEIKIRMPDQQGQDLLRLFRRDDENIRTQADFRRYFKGLVIRGEHPSNASLYFFKTPSDNALMRIYFRIKSPFNEARVLEFGMNTGKQFNHIETNHNGTPLAAFPASKDLLLSSAKTGRKSYIFSPAGIYTKISFPDVYDIKDRADFTRIVKAELVIKPQKNLHSPPYTLAPRLLLYLSGTNNLPGLALADEISREELDGNLVIDELSPEKTAYTYDITGYINSIIQEGRFSESALILSAPLNSSSSTLNRLILPDQASSDNVRLKLYLLTL